MLPFILALQVSVGPVPPASAPAPSPPSAIAPPAAASGPPAAQPPPGYPPPGYPPPAYAPSGAQPVPYPQPPPGYEPAQPQPYGYGAPYYPPYPAQAPPPYPPQTPPPPARPEVLPLWFVRAQIGIGPGAFSKEEQILQEDGYGGPKLWVELDGGYMLKPTARHLGFGLWGAFSYQSSSPSANAPALVETDFFVGGEVPVCLGSPAISFFFAPRLGFAAGSLSFGGDVPTQKAFAWGGQIGAVSSRYHILTSLGLIRAVVGPPGAAGADHDLGGLYFTIGGMIDGG